MSSQSPYPNGIYNGRMECDGNGNLLAGEGEHAGFPIAYHDGSFVFVQPGEPSHNDRHHQRFAQSQRPGGEFSDVIDGTVDESMIPVNGDRSLINTDETTNAHHFGVLEDDPHYHEGAQTEAGRVTNTKAGTITDAISARITGHTASISLGESQQ